MITNRYNLIFLVSFKRCFNKLGDAIGLVAEFYRKNREGVRERNKREGERVAERQTEEGERQRQSGLL